MRTPVALLWLAVGALLAPQIHAQESATAVVRANGVQVRAGPMSLTLAPGWQAQERMAGVSDRVIMLGAANLAPGETCGLMVSSAEGASGAANAHQWTWNGLLEQMGAPGPQTSGRSGRFEWAQAQITSKATGQPEWVRFYSAVSGTVQVTLLLAANSQRQFTQHAAALDAAVAAANFSGAGTTAQAPSPSTRPASPATTSVPAQSGDAKDVPVVASYIRAQVQFGSMSSGVLTDHILFFANGIVVREGVISGPRECYANISVSNLQSLPFNYGRWRERTPGGDIDVTWQEAAPWHLERQGDKLTLAGRALLRLRPLDGLRPHGQYVYQAQGQFAQLRLGRDGSYEAQGVMPEMSCMSARPSVVPRSRGTYEFRKWTLMLRPEGGAPMSFPVHVLSDQDLQRLAVFSLNNHEFKLTR
jgi:hypothetical protein